MSYLVQKIKSTVNSGKSVVKLRGIEGCIQIHRSDNIASPVFLVKGEAMQERVERDLLATNKGWKIGEGVGGFWIKLEMLEA